MNFFKVKSILFFHYFCCLCFFYGVLISAQEINVEAKTAEAFSFFTDETTIWLGQAQVIPFQSHVFSQDYFPSYTLEPEGFLELLKPPSILKGASLGYLHLFPKKEGLVTLKLGSASLKIFIKKEYLQNFFLLRKPKIVGPVLNSVVWNEFTIAVEVFAPENICFPEKNKIFLQLPNGTQIRAKTQQYYKQGPFLHAVFSLNAQQLLEGENAFVASFEIEEQTLWSDPLSLVVAHPVSEELIKGECEDCTGIRPRIYGQIPPVTSFDPNASQHGFTVNYVPHPALCVPVEIPSRGLYQVMVRARGDVGGGALPTLGLYIDEQSQPIGTARLLDENWHRVPLGPPILLDPNSYFFTFFFMNDFRTLSETDRNLYLDCYEVLPIESVPLLNTLSTLAKVNALNNMRPEMESSSMSMENKASEESTRFKKSTILDTSSSNTSIDPLEISILYPPQNHFLGGDEIIIAQISSPLNMGTLELFIDGVSQKMSYSLSASDNTLFLPLLVRDLNAGEHTLYLHVQDRSGQKKESNAISFTFLANEDLMNFTYPRAVRLLNRFAYGPDQESLKNILVQGESTWWQEQINASPTKEALLFEEICSIYPRDEEKNQICLRVLRYLLKTKYPLKARFLQWKQNHFSIHLEKVRALAKWREFEAFFQQGIAPFRFLLQTSSSSPAMLFYLDQHESFKGRINENYARELLELHTMGVNSGYTQTEVTALARLLNGLSFSEEGHFQGIGAKMEWVFRYDPLLNAGTTETILGMRFSQTKNQERYTQVSLLFDLLATHPQTALFISQKIIHHYWGISNTKVLPTELQQTFMRTGGDLKSILTQLKNHPLFWDNTLPQKVFTPLELALRMSRLFNQENEQEVREFLIRTATDIFGYPTPDGYPEENEYYSSSNLLLQRWKFLNQLQPYFFKLIPTGWQTEEHLNNPKMQQKILDTLFVRVLGTPASKHTQKQWLNFCAKLQGSSEEKKHQMITFFCALPELNFR